MTAEVLSCPNPKCRSPFVCPGGCEARGTVVDRLRDLADELEQATATADLSIATSGLFPIPGNQLRVGDRLWVNTTDVLVVEHIGLSHGPKVNPMLKAYGTKQYGSWEPGVTCSGEEPFFGDEWVVVER